MSDIDEQLAALEARRAAKKEAETVEFKKQLLIDLTALADLEDEHGYERVHRINIGGWKPDEGAATMVIVRIPKTSESVFKRYEQTVAKSKAGTDANLNAAHMLTDACLLYPSKKDAEELYDATMEFAAGIRSHAALEIAKVVQGQSEDEKKR